MTAEQIHRLRKSFCVVERKADVAALLFYQQLFEMDPGLQPLFKTDIELQAIKLMAMLESALDLLERPIELGSTLRDLGARHVGYGVKPIHYATVGSALMWMLENILGKDFTLETRQAWVALYQLVAETMLRGAEHATR
jgi:hemoglobin-like flavoprotein